MKILSVIVLLSVSLLGCVSGVQPLDNFGAYAPINASDEQWLTVSYLAEGASFVQESRKKEAYKRMYDHCGGKYELKEGVKSGGDSAFIGTGSNMTAFYNSKNVTFIFKCVK